MPAELSCQSKNPDEQDAYSKVELAESALEGLMAVMPANTVADINGMSYFMRDGKLHVFSAGLANTANELAIGNGVFHRTEYEGLDAEELSTIAYTVNQFLKNPIFRTLSK